VKLTTDPEIEQTEVAEASIVKVTVFPDAPPVAVTVYVGPPIAASEGGVEVKVMACENSLTANDC